MIDVLLAYKIKFGMERRYQEYLGKVLPVTQAQEPYVLEYRIFQGEDGTFVQHERYEGEQGLWQHLEVTAAGIADFAAATEILWVRVLGDITQELRDFFGVNHGFTEFRSVVR